MNNQCGVTLVVTAYGKSEFTSTDGIDYFQL